jgi:hypothetical protein
MAQSDSGIWRTAHKKFARIIRLAVGLTRKCKIDIYLSTGFLLGVHGQNDSS